MTHQCSICRLEFADPELARRCEQWCSTHDSCNLEIGRQAIRRTSAPGSDRRFPEALRDGERET